MRLYITPGSPYARIARIMVIEKKLEDRVEIEIAQTRIANSPYYRVNPSGRVPYLIRDDGVGMEELAVICRYLDHLDGKPDLNLPAGDEGLEALRLGALATSLMDGVSVLGREIGRAGNEQSPTVIRHEIDRAGRMIGLWETEIDHRWMQGKLNLIQITLSCALGLEARYRDFQWREGHPKLCAWFARMTERASIAQTAPPAGH